MPLYFAYGSNMDEAALRTRCPRARRLGFGRLARHRFALMSSGYATVRRDANAEVHGVLYDLALSDIPPLDLYEDVDNGLYVKVQKRVRRGEGRSSLALVYLGIDERDGPPQPNYMEAVVAAARAAALPDDYIASLERFLPGPRHAR